jgi:hypothetical protein
MYYSTKLFFGKVSVKLVLVLTLLSLVLLLTACQDATQSDTPTAATASLTNTVQPTSGATTSSTTTQNSPYSSVAAPTPLPKPSATAGLAQPTATHEAQPTTTSGVQPIIRFSANPVKIGDKLTVSGRGYQAYQKFAVYIFNPATKSNNEPKEVYAVGTTDAQGSFIVDMDTLSGTINITGSVMVQVETASPTGSDSTILASTSLNVIENKELTAASKGVIEASSSSMKYNSEVTINGHNFPPNTQFKIMGGIQNPGMNHGTVKTDANGNFSTKAKMVDTDTNSLLKMLPTAYTFGVVMMNGHFLHASVRVIVTDGIHDAYVVAQVVSNNIQSDGTIELADVDGSHQKFSIKYNSASTPKVMHMDGTSTSLQDVQAGDRLEIRGRWIPSSNGGELSLEPTSIR